MRRDSTRSWLFVSAAATCLLALALPPGLAAQDPETQHHANEVTLARLRPGRDTLATAEKYYKPKYRANRKGSEDPSEWWDSCRGRSLKLEVDQKGVIQSVSVSALAPKLTDCQEKRGDVYGQVYWVTGLGLKLGDPRNRVTDLYGEPNSSGPSVKGDRELELLFYLFDWAGPGVPQVMEVYCERATGRVVEITLAFPNL